MNLEEKLLQMLLHLDQNHMHVYLMDDGGDHKKAKGTKNCVIKQKVMFENYKDCLFNNKTVYRSQERFKSYCHNVYAE